MMGNSFRTYVLALACEQGASYFRKCNFWQVLQTRSLDGFEAAAVTDIFLHFCQIFRCAGGIVAVARIFEEDPGFILVSPAQVRGHECQWGLVDVEMQGDMSDDAIERRQHEDAPCALVVFEASHRGDILPIILVTDGAPDIRGTQRKLEI